MSKLLKVGITHGDINGIGYELILKLLVDPEILEICTPIVFGSPKVAAYQSKSLKLEPINFNLAGSSKEIIDGRANMINIYKEDLATQFGEKSELSEKAENASLKAALEAYKNGEIDVLVTTPGYIHNDITSHALTAYMQQELDSTAQTYDFILSGDLRIISIMPVDDYGTLSKEVFKTEVRNINQALRAAFTELRPRIAVVTTEAQEGNAVNAALADTQNAIRSALKELHDDGILSFGPFDAQTIISDCTFRHYDAILSLAKDATSKTIFEPQCSDTVIGYTAGLPLVHTYPCLSPSYEIAGKGEASETSLRDAIYTAIDLYRARQSYKNATRKPLEKQWIPRGRDDFKLDLSKDDNAN